MQVSATGETDSQCWLGPCGVIKHCLQNLDILHQKADVIFLPLISTVG